MKHTDFAELMTMITKGELSSRGGKDILAVMFEKGGEPKKLADQMGLIQKNDAAALEIIINEVVANNTNVVEEYKAGKDSLLQFLIGQGMKLSKGSANPGLLKELFIKKLKS